MHHVPFEAKGKCKTRQVSFYKVKQAELPSDSTRNGEDNSKNNHTTKHWSRVTNTHIMQNKARPEVWGRYAMVLNKQQ